MTVALLIFADSGHMDDWGAGWWILMALMMVVFWALVIAGIVWLVRTLTSDHRGQAGESATELLERRLASGDISPEEYRERRAILQGRDGGG